MSVFASLLEPKTDDPFNIYMLFAGREVRIGKNCARGLEYGPRPYLFYISQPFFLNLRRKNNLTCTCVDD